MLSLWFILLIPPLIWMLAGAFGVTAPESRAIFAIAAMAASGVLMFVLQNLMYANQQRQNTRGLSLFLARYLDRISDRFREASATATRVIQGDERDAKKLSAGAQKWTKILMWLPFRGFFIEAFVRSVYYQIRRNAGYYLLTGYLLAAATIVMFYLLVEGGETRVLIALMTGYLLLAMWYVYCLRKRVVMEELNQMSWLGFDNLNLGHQMDEVIGKYAEDIGQWKGRFERG